MTDASPSAAPNVSCSTTVEHDTSAALAIEEVTALEASVLTCPGWLDLNVPLRAERDAIRLSENLWPPSRN